MCSMKWAATRCGKRRAVAAADRFGDSEAGMIATRDSFIWRRCRRAAGPTFSIAAARRGFCICWMTSPAMADFGGNRQYITTGIARQRPGLPVLMDYPRRAAENLRHRRGPAAEDHPQLLAQVAPANIAPALNVCFFFICRRLTGTARSTLRRATARSRWRSTARTCSNVFMTWSRRISACSSISPQRSKYDRTTSPLPPFTRDSAIQKVRAAEDGWNSRDAEKSLWPTPSIANGATAANLSTAGANC